MPIVQLQDLDIQDAMLFISDLHLDPDMPKITQLFFEFLEKARLAKALYILGDLFEVYIGDDDKNKFIDAVNYHLKQLTQYGLPIYFLPGNRDFLVGDNFAIQTGCKILTDPTCINLFATSTVLTHGDILCIKDKKHQLFRKITNSNFIKKIFLKLPLNFRRNIANKIRNISKTHTQRTVAYKMDVESNAVKNLLLQNDATQIIHGHTHQPNIHNFQVNEHAMRRIVLGAWHDYGNVLICRQDEMKWVDFN